MSNAPYGLAPAGKLPTALVFPTHNPLLEKFANAQVGAASPHG